MIELMIIGYIIELMIIGYITGMLAIHIYKVHKETSTVKEYVSVLWRDFKDWAWD